MTRHSDLGSDLVRRRLASHRLSGGGAESPLDLVRWMGAVQAQDFAGGLWAPSSSAPSIAPPPAMPPSSGVSSS